MPDSSNCVFHSADSCGVPVGPRNRVWHISCTGKFTLCTRRVLHFNKDERVNEDVVVAHVVHGSQSVTTVVRGVVMESSVGRGIGHVKVVHVDVEHVEVEHVEDIVVAVADNASNASVAVKRASVHTVGGEVDINRGMVWFVRFVLCDWVALDRWNPISRNRNRGKRQLLASCGSSFCSSFLFIITCHHHPFVHLDSTLIIPFIRMSDCS